MRSNWKKYRVSDLGKIVTGKTPRTSISENYGGDIPFLTPSDDMSVKRIWNTRKTITQKGLAEVRNSLIPKNAVSVSCIGSDLGKVVMTTKPTVTNQQINSIIVNDKFVPDFVYYAMCILGHTLNYVGKASTAVPIVNKSSFSSYEILAPDKKEQLKISSLLAFIDDKIELNEKINENLERQIKLFFRKWFMDYLPFKQDGMTNSEFGSIPNGWNIQKLEDFIAFQEGPGIRNWQYVPKDGIKFINIRCIQNNDIILEKANMISKQESKGKYYHFMLKEWDVVISTSGTLGRYSIVRKDHLPLCLNTSVIRFQPKRSFEDFSFILGYLTSQEFYNHLFTKASGSVQPNFGPMHLRQISLVVPPQEVSKRYHEAVFPMIEKTLQLKSESRNLRQLRDCLIPKLMSGKIDVSGISV